MGRYWWVVFQYTYEGGTLYQLGSHYEFKSNPPSGLEIVLAEMNQRDQHTTVEKKLVNVSCVGLYKLHPKWRGSSFKRFIRWAKQFLTRTQ